MRIYNFRLCGNGFKENTLIPKKTLQQRHTYEHKKMLLLAFEAILTDIVFSKQLHSHNGKYEDNNAQYKGQIT